MKKHLLKLLLVAQFVLLPSAGPAHAQASQSMVASIPFDFRVRGERFSAGVYFITGLSPQAGSPAIHLRSRDGKVNRIYLTTPAEPRRERSGSALTLTFNRYGDDHFLTKVLNPSQGLMAKLPKAKSEKTLSRRFGGPRVLTVLARPGLVPMGGS